MIKNFLRTALRNMWRTKLFSAINILGLAIGVSASLVIFLIVQFDMSFERFQPNRDRIYRVVSDLVLSNEPIHVSGVPWPTATTTRRELNGLLETVPLWWTSAKVAVQQPGHTGPVIFNSQPHLVYTDSHYFQMVRFYTWLAGSARDLDAPNHTVLTAGRAFTYFPGLTPTQIIGRTILYDDSIPSVVSGIVSDPPANTDFSFREFISMPTVTHTRLKIYIGEDNWDGIVGTCQMLVELAPGVKPETITKQLTGLRKKYAGESAGRVTHQLQPLSDLHFNATYDTFGQRIAHKPTLYGLMLVAIFLLTLASINFINLSTANASRRAKEIGIRKTFGSSRPQLLVQFLGEAFLYTLFSLGLSLLLTPWLLHVFTDFIPPGLHFDLQPSGWLFLSILALTVTALAGFYPAWVLSRFQPVKVLKNQTYIDSNTRSSLLRKGLTTFQFAIAQAFIIATLVVGAQLRYTLNADLGFKKDAIVSFAVPFTYDKPDNKRFTLLDRIRNIPGVQRAASGAGSPSEESWSSSVLRYTNGKKIVEADVLIRYGDTAWRRIYQMPLLAGNDLRLSDTTAEFIINRTYCTMLGFKTPEEAIGKMIGEGDRQVPIVGVIADFHQASFHTPIKPLVLTCARGDQFNIHIAVQPQQPGSNTWHKTMTHVEAAFKNVYPGQDFSFEFVDDAIAKYYVAEQHLSRLLKWATGLTILISFLGLAGLVIFTTNTRTKEIGIRKVLGASVTTIVTLLSKEFVKLLVIAFAIATPIAWWAIHKWLQSFAYRAPVSWRVFPIAGVSMIGLALATMSIRTIRAATANPVDSLRTE